MNPLYTPEQMQQMDRVLIDSGAVSGYVLMGYAVAAFYAELRRLVPDLSAKKVAVFCGSGNNGGDGLCVLRMLARDGIDASGFLVTDSFRGDAALAYDDALRAACSMKLWDASAEETDADVIVDALFGTGLNRPIEGRTAELIRSVNNSGAFVVSVDIPSGISGETGRIMGEAVRADATVTFQYLKPGLLLFPGRSYAGEVRTVPIFPTYPAFETNLFTFGSSDFQETVPAQRADDHKGRNGRVLILAGSRNYAGASLMASAAALRVGAGLTYCAVPYEVRTQFSRLPEVICMPVGNSGDDCWNERCCRNASELIAGKDALCAGPGMGKIGDAGLLEALLKSGLPCVLDADALNCSAEHPSLKELFHPGVVVTPHAGEMSRLTGSSIEEILLDPVGTAVRCAEKWNCVVLLKGATTCVSDGRRCVLNTTGNEGLAKGGSGDVLSGIITALLGMHVAPFQAACAGAYLLGVSADHALELLKKRMLAAGDVVSAIRQTVDSHFP